MHIISTIVQKRATRDTIKTMETYNLILDAIKNKCDINLIWTNIDVAFENGDITLRQACYLESLTDTLVRNTNLRTSRLTTMSKVQNAQEVDTI